MPTLKNKSDGKIVIDKEVIKKTAAFAAKETYGIVGLTKKPESGEIARLLSFFASAGGVKVQLNKDGSVSIELCVIVQYGVKISVVADNLIEKIKYDVENQTGFKVKKITVNVEGVKVTA